MNPLIDHDLTAEQTILGVYIHRPDLALRQRLHLDDFHEGYGHQHIFAALLDQADRGIAGSFQILHADLQNKGVLEACGDSTQRRGVAYLFHLRELGQIAIAHDEESSRRQIRVAAWRRGTAAMATRIMQAVSNPDPELAIDQVAEFVLGAQILLDDNGIDGDRPLPGLRTVGALLGMPEEPRRWVVPGLIEKQDRVMLIAPEGHGKSVLSRQIALCAAAGVHPLVQIPGAVFPPHRTLLVDLENPLSMVRRDLRVQVNRLIAMGADDTQIRENCAVWNWPSGLDIRMNGGRHLLTRAIEQTRPDLVCIGPLYKMAEAKSSESYEEQAQHVAASLDSLRQKYDLAFWIEHHMPKPQEGRRTNPFGASLWMRWPEFGLRMEQPKDGKYALSRFRGDREERSWPQQLTRSGPLMWNGLWDDDDDEMHVVDLCTEAGQ